MGQKTRKPHVPDIIIVLHSFGSNLKWNPHLHFIITAGGLSLDGQRWISAPKRYLVPAPLLGTEWKLNVIRGIRQVHKAQSLVRKRLRKDHRRRIDIDLLLGHISKKRWHILIGPSLRSPEKAAFYVCRYTKRPVIAEGRIVKIDQGHVTFRFKDYHRAGAQSFKKLPVLIFIDRLVQHLPERNFRQVRYYGLFSSAKRRKHLVMACQILAQRKKRRPSPTTWEQKRKAEGNGKPLSCPWCDYPMVFSCSLFGNHSLISKIVVVKLNERIPPKTFLIDDDNYIKRLAA
jgi:hypothetical protein